MTFFVDANLDGPTFAEPLRAAGIALELHRDHFARDADDTLWIPEVAKRGWVAVTNDKSTKLKDLEVLAIVRSGARMLYIKKKQGVSARLLAENFVNTTLQIERFFERHTPPCAGSLVRPNKLEDVWAKKPGQVHSRPLKLPPHLSRLAFSPES